VSTVVPVLIRIMDKEYRIACPDNEREALVESAEYVNRRMRELRDSGKVIGADRIAVMTALNIAHELLQTRSDKDERSRSLNTRIRVMQDKVEAALGGRQMEL
jgi:cell division protein ZapA